jgi:hypothetical protein
MYIPERYALFPSKCTCQGSEVKVAARSPIASPFPQILSETMLELELVSWSVRSRSLISGTLATTKPPTINNHIHTLPACTSVLYLASDELRIQFARATGKRAYKINHGLQQIRSRGRRVSQH